MPLCRHILNRQWSSRDQAGDGRHLAVARGSDVASIANAVQSKLNKLHADQVTMATEPIRHLPLDTGNALATEYDVTDDGEPPHSWNYTFNATGNNKTTGYDTDWRGEAGFQINELQLIKVVVLVVVLSILLLSTCKLVMKTFSRFAGGVGRKDDSFWVSSQLNPEPGINDTRLRCQRCLPSNQSTHRRFVYRCTGVNLRIISPVSLVIRNCTA